MRDHLRSTAKRAVHRAGLAPIAARLLRASGADDLATRLVAQQPGPVVTVELPRAAAGPQTRISMHTLDGRDQVARALAAGGWQGFEPPLPSAVAAFFRRWGGTLLDVGANTGLYSLIATAAHRRARAVAFEPVPEIVALLRSNLALNDAGRRVRVHEVAIGDSSGTATLYLPPSQADGTIETSASLESDFKSEIDRVVEVRTSTLDDIWEQLGRPAITMVKIDVEGSEARVLAGASTMVERCQPIVSVEVLAHLDPSPIEASRSRLGYVDVALAPDLAIVGRPGVVAERDRPNHLLVPPERLDAVLEDLRSVEGLAVADER